MDRMNTSRVLNAFAREMESLGHRVFMCRAHPTPCDAVLWLEADCLQTLKNLTVLRNGSTPEKDCTYCATVMKGNVIR